MCLWSRAVTALDGYPLAQQGKAGPAIFITTIASFFGSCFAILCLAAFSPIIAQVALSFGSAEYFALMVFGLVTASTVAPGSQIKGMAMVIAGLVIGLVGTDITSGTFRFTLGMVELTDGITLVAVAMGVFGATEVINNLSRTRQDRGVAKKVRIRELIPSREDIQSAVKPRKYELGN